MKNILTTFLLVILTSVVAVTISLTAHAEKLPALTGLSTPDWSNEKSNIADAIFPRKLEEEKDYASAILEWKRVLYTSEDSNVKAKSVFQIAENYHNQNNTDEARKYYNRFITEYPKDKRIASAWYKLFVYAENKIENEEDVQSAKNILDKIHKTLGAEHELTRKAEYLHLWNAVRSGRTHEDEFVNIVENEDNKFLVVRLLTKPFQAVRDEISIQKVELERATLLSFLSGAGLVYIGNYSFGVIAFVLNLIFISALIYSLRYRLWAYSALCGIIASITYFGTIFATYTIAESKILNQDEISIRGDMDSWKILRPVDARVIGYWYAEDSIADGEVLINGF